MADARRAVRIFISSPGDVVEEREQARRVIEGLQRQYSGVTLQPVLWEELALPATASFQQSIDYLLREKPIDVAVFVLWSRLGTPLGAAITRSDGSPYRSGTEREFDLMLAAFAQSDSKRPVILAYTRDDDAGFKQKLTAAPSSELEQLIAQRKLAEQFIREQFQDAEGRNLRANYTYREPIGFAQRLRAHLRQTLDDLLGADAGGTWLEEPYRALEAFDVRHAPIFQGRDEETCGLLQRLRDQQRAGCAFVAIIGASGSGKSSLARAGVAASLLQHAGDDGVKQWRAVFFVPALEADDLFLRLTRVVAQAVPELGGSESALADIAAGLKSDAPLTVRLSVAPAIARAAEKAGGPVRLLLVLDQMEELWTDRRITPDDRRQLLNAVEALARSGQVAVLATLRSDFYPHAQQMPEFVRLKGERGHFDLLPPDAAALHRLIAEPARLAGLAFERHEQTGRTLDEVALQDAARDPGALPLLQYALSELYRQRDAERRLLTFAAYQAMGGVEGALGKRAAEVFQQLPAESQAALAEILPLLVTVDVGGEQAAVRRRAPLADLTATPARQQLTEHLIAARFLTTDQHDSARVASLAHEALLRRWPQIASWVAANREHLRLRARVEQSQQRWEQQGRDESLLLTPGLPLEEARQLLNKAPHLLGTATADYIRASISFDERRVRQRRRLRRVVMSGLSVLTVLALAAATMAWLKQREAAQQREAATQKAKEAEEQRRVAVHKEAGEQAINKFYEDYVLAAARPKGWSGGVGKDVTLKEALDNAASKIEVAFAGQPELEAAVHNTLGMTYYYLGEFNAASPHLAKAQEIRLRALGPDSPDTLVSLHNLAMLRWKQGYYGEAITLGRQALAKRRLVLGPENKDTLFTQLNLGLFLEEDAQYEEAEAVLRQGVEVCKRVLGPEHHHTLYGQSDLALVLNTNGKLQEALDLDRRTLEGRKRTLGPEHPDTLRSMANLADTLWNLDKLADAEALCRQALEARRRVLGEGHEETFWSLTNLAGILDSRGKLSEAEAQFRQNLKDCERLRGADDKQTLACLDSLGSFLRSQGKFAEAEAIFRRLVAASRSKFGPEHVWTLMRQYELAWVLDESGKAKDAESIYRETLAAQRRVRGAEHVATLNTQNNLAALLVYEERYTEAEKLFRELLDIYQRKNGPDHPNTLQTQEWVAGVLERECNWEEAEKFYDAVRDARQRQNGAEHSSVLDAQELIARLWLTWGKLDDAERLWRRLLDSRTKLVGAEHPSTLRVQASLGRTLQAQGKRKQAEEILRKTLDARRRVLGAEHLATLSTQESLATVLGDLGGAAEAEKMYRATLEIRRRTEGGESPDTLAVQNDLADLLWNDGRVVEAEKLLRQTWEAQRKSRGAEHLATLATQAQLAVVLAHQAQATEAERLLREALTEERKRLPPDHLTVAATLADLGDVLTAAGQPAEAEPLLRECLAIRQKRRPAGHWQIATAQSLLGGCLAAQKKFADGESLVLAGIDVLSKPSGASRRQVDKTFQRVIDLYQAWGKTEQAEAWRKKRPARGIVVASSE